MSANVVPSGRRHTRGRRWRLLFIALLASVLALSACTGVPSSSVPQTIRTIDGSGINSDALTIRPQAGADPRQIVADFLQANVSNDEKHPAARQFLTAAQSAKWQDSTVTIVDDTRVGVLDQRTNLLTVTGRVIGSLDSDGVYTPVRTLAAAERSFAFTLSKVDGQWRISDLPPGLVITRRDFINAYTAHPVYYFNQDETRLVPDVRYSAAEQQSLASWLLTQLVNGPSALSQQQQSPLRNEVPDQIAASSAKVTIASPITVQLPGIGQADQGTVWRVAAELAYTFAASSLGERPIVIYDGNRQVSLANGTPTLFQRSNFTSVATLPQSVPSVYYVRDGGAVDQDGKAMAGPIGTNRFGLTSIAVAPSGSDDLRVAGVAADGRSVIVGTQNTTLSSVTLPAAATSRPEWTRGRVQEVWVGVAGATSTRSSLQRIVGTTVQPVPMSARDEVPVAGSTVLAVRVSPEGARVAVVLRSADGTTTSVWIGLIERSDKSVQVVGLRRITPSDWTVADVAWSDASALRVLLTQANDFEIWSLQDDGSLPSSRRLDNLPPGPVSLTSAPNALSWVAVAGPTVWEEAPTQSSWVSPKDSGLAPGSAPSYASI